MLVLIQLQLQHVKKVIPNVKIIIQVQILMKVLVQILNLQI